MKISLVIITSNEEKRLPAALASCQAIADEIIVFDSFSTDRTAEVARQFGAQFFQHPFADYGSQKNLALAKASHDWVLSLDADERLSVALRDQIARWKESPPAGVSAFRMARRAFYLGRWVSHSGWYPQPKVRLFAKERARWQGSIHERLVVDGLIADMPGDILHFTFQDITDHIRRIDRYTSLQAEDIAQNRRFLIARSLLLPPFTFLRHYVWRLGFLDGLAGLVIATISSWATALKYFKAAELRRLRNKAGCQEADQDQP